MFKASSASSVPGQNSTAWPIPVASSVAEFGKGPRRRNRAERAALQQEHELLEQQKAKRSFRYQTPCHLSSTFCKGLSSFLEPQNRAILCYCRLQFAVMSIDRHATHLMWSLHIVLTAEDSVVQYITLRNIQCSKHVIHNLPI